MNSSATAAGKPLKLADSVAYLSRRLSKGNGRKLAQLLFRYYPAKTGTVVIRDFDGDLRISLDRGSFISGAIYWSGHHSLPLVNYLRGFLRPEMTLVDIGANIGEITLYAAKRLNSGRVLSFEPMPSVFAQLARNVTLNQFRNVELFNLGLYDSDGVLPLYAKEDNAFGMVNEGVSSLFGSTSTAPRANVPLRKFDDIAQEANLQRLDFLKVDVEGAEWMALRGAENSLRRFRPVIVAESSASNFRKAGYSAKELYGYLVSLGYEVRSLEDASANLPPECDILCLPRKN